MSTEVSCQYCAKGREFYVYAKGTNPLDSSQQACEGHVAKAREAVDVGEGATTVRLVEGA